MIYIFFDFWFVIIFLLLEKLDLERTIFFFYYYKLEFDFNRISCTKPY